MDMLGKKLCFYGWNRCYYVMHQMITEEWTVGWYSLMCVLLSLLMACSHLAQAGKEQEALLLRQSSEPKDSPTEKRGVNPEILQVEGVELSSVYRRLEKAGFQPGLYKENDFTQLVQAITRFQRFAKLPETGVIDQETWTKIQKLYDPGGPATVKPSQILPESKSETSAEPSERTASSLSSIAWPPSVIQTIQFLLTELGYPTSATGTGDGSTQEALRQFQQEHHLSVDGTLNQETVLTLLEERCKHGCNLTFSISATAEETTPQSQSLTGKNEVRIALSGAVWSSLFIQGMQALLTQQGYDTRGTDGKMGPFTEQAIRQFQSDQRLPDNGEFTGETISALINTGCRYGCKFLVSLRASQPLPSTSGASPTAIQSSPVKKPSQTVIPAAPQPLQQTESIIVKKIQPDQVTLHYLVFPDDTAYALEKVECSDISGDWVIFYQGTVVEKDEKAVTLRLEERFGYRYSPSQEGIDRTSWWCIPKRRHCYSPIAFSDWGGTLTQNQMYRFPVEKVYHAQIGIINGISLVLQQQCRR